MLQQCKGAKARTHAGFIANDKTDLRECLGRGSEIIGSWNKKSSLGILLRMCYLFLRLIS